MSDLERNRQAAYRYARGKGMRREDADDFAQYVALQTVRGKAPIFRFAVRDFWDKERGRIGTARHTANCATVGFLPCHEPSGSPEDALIALIDFAGLLSRPIAPPRKRVRESTHALHSPVRAITRRRAGRYRRGS